MLAESARETAAWAYAAEGARFWRRLWRQPLFWVGAAFLVFLLLFAFVGPEVWRRGNGIDVATIFLPPGPGHPLGTDGLGRDYLHALMLGGKLPILSGFATALAATVLGVAGGLAAGFARRWEAIILRVADAILSIPPLVPILIIEGFFGVNIVTLMVTVTLVSWPSTARLVWTRTLVLREMPFIEAARATGARESEIVRRHLLPNAFDTIVACFATQFGNAVLFIALATMLGAGLGAATNWATMIATSRQNMYNFYWWLVLPPGIAFALLILSVFFLAESVRQAFNPRALSGRARP